ncbi:efflux RND transporter periplasmic adaptor subunit [Methylosoma difficile]
MIKRMLIMLVLVGLVLGGIFGFINFKARMTKQFMTAGGEPSQTVSTLVASHQDWQPKQSAVGSLRAVQGVEISAEVSGQISQIYFQQGQPVQAGQPLLQLRADDEQARLSALTATAKLAQITYQRSQAQWNAKAISQQTLDSDKANLDIALANIAAQQALLDKKLVRAPFTGQLGLRNVDVGQYLEAGKPISTLQALDSLYIDFFLPQQALPLLATQQAVTVKSDAYPDQDFTGTISVISPKVDADTRNVQLRATLKNPDHKLLPGMYATVTISTGAAQSLITLPRTAISFSPYGSTVYIVSENGKDDKGNAKLIAKQSFVTTGASRGDQIAVLNGVAAGDAVVTSGQIKLHNGSPVLVNNSLPPSFQPNPQPVDH